MSATTAAITTATSIPTLAIPSRSWSMSRPDGMSMYPTSPLGVFPPPMPSTRRTLRDRCGVDLTLEIDAPLKTFKAPGKALGPWSPKGHAQPHRTNLPRRRNPKPRFASFQEVKPPTPAEAIMKLAPADAPALAPQQTAALPPPKAEEPHLQAIIPAVWVAFSQTSAQPHSATSRAHEEGFTHIVEICHADDNTSSIDAKGNTEHRWEGSVRRLCLVLPSAARQCSGRAGLALSDTQLRAARDFIAECLPQSLAILPDQHAVRVLVTTPPGRPTDAMCVLGAYLGFVAERDVDSILRCIDEEESILSVWKGEVSGEEVERADKVARGWSWLSAVVPAPHPQS